MNKDFVARGKIREYEGLNEGRHGCSAEGEGEGESSAHCSGDVGRVRPCKALLIWKDLHHYSKKIREPLKLRAGG